MTRRLCNWGWIGETTNPPEHHLPELTGLPHSDSSEVWNWVCVHTGGSRLRTVRWRCRTCEYAVCHLGSYSYSRGKAKKKHTMARGKIAVRPSIGIYFLLLLGIETCIYVHVYRSEESLRVDRLQKAIRGKTVRFVVAAWGTSFG
ncbi:hypothetical protein BJX70DRAFT_267956 [Aspergillus crustosus]